MFHAEWKFGMADFEKISAIRESAGVAVTDAAAFSAVDGYAAHILVTDDETGEGIASARLYPDGELTRIDAVAVVPERSREPFAEFLLRLALYKAQTLGGAYIAVAAESGLASLCERFGMEAHGVGEYRCPRDGVKWFSQCGDAH